MAHKRKTSRTIKRNAPTKRALRLAMYGSKKNKRSGHRSRR